MDYYEIFNEEINSSRKCCNDASAMTGATLTLANIGSSSVTGGNGGYKEPCPYCDNDISGVGGTGGNGGSSGNGNTGSSGSSGNDILGGVGGYGGVA